MRGVEKSSGSVAERFEPEHAGMFVCAREDAPAARFPLLERMIVERGTRDDWDRLHELHYKAENLPLGPRYWRLSLDGETIGVIVTSNPKGLLKERHLVFPKLKPGANETKITNTHRYVWINANFRVVARFVIDTMYRGIGAGYRMMNLVARMEGNPFMEIQSSMSKFNLFGQRAGFSFAAPMNANKFEVGLKFFRGHFGASPQDYEALVAEIEAKAPAARAALMQSCRDFYWRHSALEKTGQNRDKSQADRVDGLSPRALVKNIQQIVLASPMYGVWKNPEPGRAMPERLPLSAFDAQDPKEKFSWT